MAAENTITLRIAAEDAFSATMQKAVQAFALLGKESLAELAKIQGAFQTLNIKSQLDIDVEKKRIVSAFETIKHSGIASADEIKRAQAAMHAELDKLDGKVPRLKSSFSELEQTIAGAFTLRSIADFVKSSFEASLSIDSINSKLKVLTGSTESANREWEFIRATAKRLGLDLQQTAESYSSFAVATKNTSLEGAKARSVFVGISEAVTALHLPAEKASGILNQFQQMLSKGKINMEDMKTASESFPGLMQMTADALGITTGQLMSQMEAGTVMTNDTLPKLGDALHATYGAAAEEAATKGRAALNNFNTSIFEMKSRIGADLAPGLIYIGNALLNIMKAVVGGWMLISNAAAYVIETIRTNLDLSLNPEEKRRQLAEIADTYHQQVAQIVKNYGEGQKAISQSENESLAESIENGNRRRKEAQKTGEDLAKINLEYAKSQNDIETISAANYQKAYEERKKATIDYYNQKKAYAKDDGEEAAWEKLKKAALLQIDKQHAEDSKLVAVDQKQFLLKNAQELADTEIKTIQAKVKQHEISENDGAMRVLEIQKKSAQDVLALARVKEQEYARIYGTNGEEYKKLLKAREDAEQAFLKVSGDSSKRLEANKKRDWELSLSDYKNILDKESLYIQENCDRGTISVKEAAVLRLAAETDYLEKVKILRARQVAELNPETQALEYQKAVSAKIEADKQYDTHYNQLLIAREKLTKENEAAATEQHREELERRKKADQDALQQQRDFAASWFALWDNAYNDGATSLKQLSDAAYNAFAKMNKLPLTITESIESVAEAASQAKKEAFEMGQAAEQAGMLSGAVWGPTIKSLQMISVNAKQITADFLDQKLSALTLADGLEHLKGATPAVIRAAEDSIKNFKLLDSSTLDKIKGQVERLKGIVESFRDSIKSTVSNLQEELDNLTLSKSSLETKRYEQQVVDLNQKLREAVELNDQQSAESLKQAIANAKKIHDIKMKDLAEEAAAAKNTNSATTTSNTTRQPGFNRGGRFPGNSLYDTLQVWARPGEWFVRNEAADFWGDNFMAAINDPWSDHGRAIAAITAAAPYVGGTVPVPTPGVGFNGGGKATPVNSAPITVNIYTNNINESTVRRDIVPVLDKLDKLKR